MEWSDPLLYSAWVGKEVRGPMTEHHTRQTPGPTRRTGCQESGDAEMVPAGSGPLETDAAPADQAQIGRPGADKVEELAGQVLSVLAARGPAGDGASGETKEDQTVVRLISAVQQHDEAERDRVVARLIRDGIRIEDLIDHYIPEAARHLGLAWCSDGMSFADVTIGSARLQGLLRDLIRRTTPSHVTDPMAPQVLMVVREDDHHTLGAMVATQKLRRIGVGVHVSVGQPDREILTLIAGRDFDLVMVSSSGSERLETLGEFVENVRNRARRGIPVVVGGTALVGNADVVAMTGADLATADPEEALKRCGLRIPRQGARLLAHLD